MTASDVIHGQCAEPCGIDHGEARAVTTDPSNTWTDRQEATGEAAKQLAEQRDRRVREEGE